jgi:hypothetical protein
MRAARIRILMLVAGLIALVGLCGLTAGGAAASAASPATSVAAGHDSGPTTTVSGLNTLDAIACPTAKACVAVGSNTALTGARSVAINAATGAVKAWPGSVAGGFLAAVACPATSRCVAVSDDAVETVAVSNAALKLTGTVKASSGITAMGAIACAGSSACYAVGFQGTEVASKALLVKISAAGKILSTVTTASGTGIGAIACPSASTCLLAEHTKTAELAVPLTGGRFGTARAFPAGTFVQAVSCYAAKLCYALGGHIGTGLVRTNEMFPLNPKTAAVGKAISLGGFNGDGLACYSATECVVVGYTGSGATAVASVVTVTKGKAGAVKHYASYEPFDSAGCATAKLCYAVGPGKASGTAEVVRI